MEVHHPHHPSHKKKWSEYIIEFVMLFTAVTLGFFAENLREHTIVKEKIEKNKIAILKDLKQDAITIDSIYAHEAVLIQNYNRTINLLFLAKAGKINDAQLIDSLKTLPSIVGFTYTLYINNSNFKNMQSSGLLSNLEDNELKAKLSYYYEVIFKRIESNNIFFDEAGIRFNEFYPLGLGTFVRDYTEPETSYEYNKSKPFFNAMLDLKKSKELIKSDDFIYSVQKYYNYIFIYRLALTKAKEENNKLIQLMESGESK